MPSSKYRSFQHIVLSLAMMTVTVLLSSQWQGATAFSNLPLVHHHPHQRQHHHHHHPVFARLFGLQTPLRTRNALPWTTTAGTCMRRNTQLGVAVLTEIASTYNYALAHYTLPTETMTAAVLSCIGDLIAQALDIRDPEKKQVEFNVARTRNFFIKGVGSGVIWSIYYRRTDVLCSDWATQLLSTTAVVEANRVIITATVKTALGVLLEEVIAMPIVMSLWDIPVPALLSGSPLSTIPSQVKSKIPELVVENAKVWTLVNILIYNIPVQYRLLVMSVANVFWQAIVSKITSAEIVLENASAESLGMDMSIQAQTASSLSASLENNTIGSSNSVVDRDVVYQSVGGNGVSMAARTRESSSSSSSSALVEDSYDYAGGDEQGLLGNRMESRAQRDFQQMTTGNGTGRIGNGISIGIDDSIM
jgi:hypothetical protein